jgi:hypothetical protein
MVNKDSKQDQAGLQRGVCVSRKASWREAGEEETSVDFEEKAAPYK